MTQKGFDLKNINLIRDLNSGQINFEEYLIRRRLSRNDNLGELNYIVNDNHYMLNEYLSNISIGLRCRVMKGLFNLTNRDVDNFIDFRKSSIGYFISENMSLNKDSEIVTQRNTSLELIYDLAIVYDLPFRYLANSYTKYEMIYSFAEYNTPKIKVKKLHNLIEEIIFKMTNETKNKRNIFGVKIENDFFEAGGKKYLYARVDLREKFFTIEIYLENEANINSLELLKLEKSIRMKNEIFIRDAFLRDKKKVYILISLDKAFKKNIIYLQDEFLWRNVLSNLKNETLDILRKEASALSHPFNKHPLKGNS